MKKHMWKIISWIGGLMVSAVINLLTHSWVLPIILGSVTTILVIIWFLWDKVIIKVCNIALQKCPNINKLNAEYKESLQALNQAKDGLVYVITKILVLTDGNKKLSIGEDLAEHIVHLTLTFSNALRFHIEIESIVSGIEINGYKLGGKCKISSSWSDINSCQIEIDQPITPMVASVLRQKEESEIILGCDLMLDIWLKDANIRSQARYSFAI